MYLIMTGKESIKKAIELIKIEKNQKYNSLKGKTKLEKITINAVVSTLVNVEIMLMNLKNEIIEDSLDDEDSEIYKIGAEIAEMSDEDFSNNLNKILCNN